MLKLAYSEVNSKKISGGNTPGPPLQGREGVGGGGVRSKKEGRLGGGREGGWVGGEEGEGGVGRRVRGGK